MKNYYFTTKSVACRPVLRLFVRHTGSLAIKTHNSHLADTVRPTVDFVGDIRCGGDAVSSVDTFLVAGEYPRCMELVAAAMLYQDYGVRHNRYGDCG